LLDGSKHPPVQPPWVRMRKRFRSSVSFGGGWREGCGLYNHSVLTGQAEQYMSAIKHGCGPFQTGWKHGCEMNVSIHLLGPVIQNGDLWVRGLILYVLIRRYIRLPTCICYTRRSAIFFWIQDINSINARHSETIYPRSVSLVPTASIIQQPSPALFIWIAWIKRRIHTAWSISGSLAQ
jgi:hypothetical protein